jgi:hypothetical protein
VAATDILILITCVTATVGWCGFVWATRGVDAWRRPLAGAFLIAAAGALASSALGRRPLVETLSLALLYGVSATVLIGAIQFSVWIRQKGAERR